MYILIKTNQKICKNTEFYLYKDLLESWNLSMYENVWENIPAWHTLGKQACRNQAPGQSMENLVIPPAFFRVLCPRHFSFPSRAYRPGARERKRAGQAWKKDRAPANAVNEIPPRLYLAPWVHGDATQTWPTVSKWLGQSQFGPAA